jgi:hypothetical protein
MTGSLWRIRLRVFSKLRKYRQTADKNHQLTPVILATWGAEIGRITVQSQQGQESLRPTPAKISKIIRTKWTRSLTQAIECLLFKYEILSSNPSPTKNKNKNKKTTHSEFLFPFPV